MSWGDTPSDAYDLLNALALTSVTEEPISAAELSAAAERLHAKEG